MTRSLCFDARTASSTIHAISTCVPPFRRRFDELRPIRQEIGMSQRGWFVPQPQSFLAWPRKFAHGGQTLFVRSTAVTQQTGCRGSEIVRPRKKFDGSSPAMVPARKRMLNDCPSKLGRCRQKATYPSREGNRGMRASAAILQKRKGAVKPPLFRFRSRRLGGKFFRGKLADADVA